MGLFKKKKNIIEEKPVKQEKKKAPIYCSNSLVNFNGPVIVLGPAMQILKNNVNSKDYKSQIATLGSKKAENAFLQGYNYAIMFLATDQEITKYTEACIAFKDLPKEDRDWINEQTSNKEDK